MPSTRTWSLEEYAMRFRRFMTKARDAADPALAGAAAIIDACDRRLEQYPLDRDAAELRDRVRAAAGNLARVWRGTPEEVHADEDLKAIVRLARRIEGGDGG